MIIFWFKIATFLFNIQQFFHHLPATLAEERKEKKTSECWRPFFLFPSWAFNEAMSQFYDSLRDIWKYLVLPSPTNPYPFLLSLWPIYPAALSGLWRPHDDVIGPLTSPALCLTWPLRTTSFLSSFPAHHPSTTSPPYAGFTESCLFPKLNGRVLSHSRGYSFGQRAWPTFLNICRIVRRRMSQDNTVDSRSFRHHSSFIIIVPSPLRIKFLRYFDHSPGTFRAILPDTIFPFKNNISIFQSVSLVLTLELPKWPFEYFC